MIRPSPPGKLRSPVLRRHGRAAAESSFTRMLQTWPDLLDGPGNRGGTFSSEDNLRHLSFLDASFAGENAGHFLRYADWLLRFLSARGLEAQHVAGAFRFLDEALESVRSRPGIWPINKSSSICSGGRPAGS